MEKRALILPILGISSMLRIHQAIADWENYYPPGAPIYINNGSSRITESNDVFVDNCVFQNFSPNGVIQIDASNNLLVLSCSFLNSYSQNSNGGGSIYKMGGQSVQARICSYNTSESMSTGWGGHSYTKANGDSVSLNSLYQSTIAISKGHYNCVAMSQGNQLLTSSNISFAYNTGNVAYALWETTGVGVFNYSTIYNNTVLKEYIGFHGSSSHKIITCNFLDNKAPSGSAGIVGSAPLNIYNTIFKNNTGQYIFNCGSGSSVTNCSYLSNNVIAILNPSSSAIIGDSINLSFHLNHLSTFNCQNEYSLDFSNPVLVNTGETKKVEETEDYKSNNDISPVYILMAIGFN
ncbi:hypothetical protein TVAG_362770 [Trichomonas vaginalis G3]|uniref:Right handed beta helix domain-containing protein n=1 Tax=Trichomonas vaginalis (strain ATCC PRA-98 / G3) TaxID=412133 RepID=A2E654_TRIV3|nr:hypothetical protein TVAGG3_0366500 [Trichomonas vaginalis G3]EAY11896.1 hypothetical protein TVAG_362770 [Trichomonas vaginalis G3]KAI5532312.1 hypothetical protein TVAGG3_0366500 [Trichomonas vaginalis G3]|eukprot:XP_001324119.1 hypothetical protein [Trichomonas vaginalis G3]